MSGTLRPKQSMDQVQLSVDVYTLALERIATAADDKDHLCVAFSGGKDSTAVLNLTLEVLRSDRRYDRHLPLRCVFYDEEAIPVQTEEYMRRVNQIPDVALEWYCLPQKHRNACSRTSPWWWPWAPEARDRWCRPMPPEALTELEGFPTWPPEARMTAPDMNGLLAPPSRGNVAMLMGIRAQESLTRLRSLLRGRSREHNWMIKFDEGASKGNLWKAYPIYDWRTEDVWTAPAKLGWDYNRAYDHMEMLGLPAYAQRCSPAFGEEPLEKLHTYAACFPDVWAKMVDRVPGVGAAARYARTELYAYRGRPQKPDDMTWPEFILHYVAQFRPQDQRFVASRLKDEIRVHYRKCSLPIVPKTRHPITGVSWEWLLMLAMRGDFKGRKQAGNEANSDGTPALARQWTKYLTELEQIRLDDQLHALQHPQAHRLPTDLRTLFPTELEHLL